MIVGAKWSVVEKFGSDLPVWDQWDAEGLQLLAPWVERDHFVRNLFTPHNEHRVVVTKLQALAVATWTGQWDARLVCMLNAMLHAALGAGLWAWAAPRVQRLWLAPLFVVLATLFSLPFADQNVLGAFHSQQYWLLLLSAAAMAWLPFETPGRIRWWVALAVAVLALFTMASGLLAGAVIFVVAVVRACRGDATWRAAGPTILCALVIITTGWLLRANMEQHAHMRAHSFGAFAASIGYNLQWPLPQGRLGPGAIVLWLPWLLVLRHALRGPADEGATHRTAQTIAALGGWVVLQVAATAYARGAAGEYPASRYMDTLAFGMAVNAIALAWLASRGADSSSRARRIWVVFALAWLSLVATGLWHHTHYVLRTALPDTVKYLREAELVTRSYLVTGDRADLLSDNIPYPGTDNFIARLTRPSLQPFYPASVRPPLPLRAAAAQTETFHENLAHYRMDANAPRHGLHPPTTGLAAHPTWGSFGETGNAAQGEWRSAPLATQRAWLKFETAGDLGRGDLSLELRDADTDALLAKVQPSKTPGDAWRAAFARAPLRPFVVVARDADAAGWMAFSAPVEMSAPSYWASRLVRHGVLILECAATAAAILGLWAWRAARPHLHPR